LTVASSPFNYHVQPTEKGMRLDHYLVRHISDQSRSSLGKYIRSGHVLVNNIRVKPGYRLSTGDDILVELPETVESRVVAQPVDFKVLYEDESLLVISKPPGLVVHPAAGHADFTLVNGLLHRYGDLPGLEKNRPGIVHRLDKDTSGIMLVARTEKVQRLLAEAFKNREVHKIYHALLLRCPQDMDGRIVAPIGRHPVNRKKMAIRHSNGRYAATRWHILETFATGMCLAEIIIETGRTHQIRVHLSSLGAPVAGDVLYGGRIADSVGVRADRQLLHASTISFIHPETGHERVFTAPLWQDMELLLEHLRREYSLEG
jgi:23S rRNA pseudouridine1911/1915/1917 synthase